MSQPITIPQNFANRMVEMHGENGRFWLTNLPHLLKKLTERWLLTLHSPFTLSYNYVTPVTRADGTTAVLKIGYPDTELLTEMETLRLYNGRFACQLLAADSENYAMLLEHIQPGQPLWSLADDEAETEIAARLMQQLWQPISPEDHPNLPTLARRTLALTQQCRSSEEHREEGHDAHTQPHPRGAHATQDPAQLINEGAQNAEQRQHAPARALSDRQQGHVQEQQVAKERQRAVLPRRERDGRHEAAPQPDERDAEGPVPYGERAADHRGHPHEGERRRAWDELVERPAGPTRQIQDGHTRTGDEVG